MNVLKAEWCGLWVGCVGIFSRAKEEEEAEGDHVGNQLGSRVRRKACSGAGLQEDGDRDGFDTGGRWVSFVVAGELATEAKL